MKKNFTCLTATIIALIMVTGQLFAASDINGSVLYHYKQDKPIPSVNLDLIDASGNIIATTTTALNGTYNFINVPYGAYTIKANTSIAAGGVNMGSAFSVFMHLCNVYPLSPIQKIAADVDGNGAITWDDYWVVVIDWFLQGKPFPAGDWVFQEVTFEHTGAKTNVPPVGGSSSGDVNGSFIPSTRDVAALVVNYASQSIDHQFTSGIYAKDITEASAMGLVIAYPESQITISDVECQLSGTNLSVENGVIRISWVNQFFNTTSIDPNQPIITLNGTTTDQYDGREILFDLSPVSHFCDAKGEQISTRYTLPKLKATESYLGTNYPNPFVGSTNIDYILPSEGKVTINLFNQQGQLIKVLVNEFQAIGTHSVELNSNDLQPGIYLYNLTSEGVNETKRMIITR